MTLNDPKPRFPGHTTLTLNVSEMAKDTAIVRPTMDGE